MPNGAPHRRVGCAKSGLGAQTRPVAAAFEKADHAVSGSPAGLHRPGVRCAPGTLTLTNASATNLLWLMHNAVDADCGDRRPRQGRSVS